MRRLLPAVTGALAVGLLAAVLPMGTAGAETGDGAATTERISVAADGTQSDGTSFDPVISRNGRYAAFVSRATNLVPSAPPGDWTYLRDLRRGTLERVTVDGARADVHDFSASGNRMVLNSGNKLYVRDLKTGRDQRVDVELGEFTGGGVHSGRISGSGRYVVFTEGRPAGSTAAESARVYVRDLRKGTTQWVSHPNTAAKDYASGGPVISDDGQHIAYTSTWQPPKGAAKGNAYLLDRTTGERQMLDVSADGPTPERAMFGLSMSADGSRVLFNRHDTSPVTADDQGSNTFVREPSAGTTRPVPADGAGTGTTSRGSLSADGRSVLFMPGVASPSGGPWPLVLRNLETGEARTVTTAVDGTPAPAYPGDAAMTGDGRKVVFNSLADGIVPGDTNATWDVFVTTLPPAS
ncbi:TolB family protein [Streptomyces sp. NPDC048172]|uniref:TolB family protein n=1 Tax=Streptomyces sp. NPDC048172 TaxID=3365505 RepID=UPI00371D9EE7